MNAQHTESHYYVSNSLCYAKAEDPQVAALRLEQRATAHNPDEDLPITVIQVMQDIKKPYAICSYLPASVPMIVIQQDYPSNITLGELCFYEEGIIYYGDFK